MSSVILHNSVAQIFVYRSYIHENCSAVGPIRPTVWGSYRNTKYYRISLGSFGDYVVMLAARNAFILLILWNVCIRLCSVNITSTTKRTAARTMKLMVIWSDIIPCFHFKIELKIHIKLRH
jgi:hypothetical protein